MRRRSRQIASTTLTKKATKKTTITRRKTLRDGYAATSVDEENRRLRLGEGEEHTALHLEILAARPAHEDRLEALEESLVDFAERLRSDERREEDALAAAIIGSDASLRASQEVLRAHYRQSVARVLAERGGRSKPDIEDVR